MTTFPNLERFSLGDVVSDGDKAHIEENYDGVNLTFEDYSHFKYGDGSIGRRYGSAMARHLIPLYLETNDEPQDIYVTSSAYKVAPPASSSLVEPFVGMAQAIIESQGKNHRVIPFKINRAHLTDGDYASMTAEQRDEVMCRNGLSLPPGVTIDGRHVIAIDDIRVTGSHETSLDNLLRYSGASDVTHAYILDVVDGGSNPTIEAVINRSAITTIEDLIAVASLKHFTPNARFGKRILTESPESIERFCESLSARISSRLVHDAIGDGLDEMPRYADGFHVMVRTLSRITLGDM